MRTGRGTAAKVPRACTVPADRHVLRVDEVAGILRISDFTVRSMLDAGHLKALPVGTGKQRSHVRILTSSVRDLLRIN